VIGNMAVWCIVHAMNVNFHHYLVATSHPRNEDSNYKVPARGKEAKTKEGAAMTHGISRLVLGQVQKGNYSNEETAIPRLLEVLNVEDCIVAADGAGPLRVMARQVMERNGRYVFRVDQGYNLICEAIEHFFRRSLESDYSNPDVDQREYTEQDPEKNEVRRYHYARGINGITPQESWPGMTGVGMAQFFRDGRETERRYYVSNISDQPEDFFCAVAGHCEGEHNTHWCMSITFPNHCFPEDAAGNVPVFPCAVQ
jgi:predicted transposase YbfD/YdcC